jgi:hypothetical protein
MMTKRKTAARKPYRLAAKIRLLSKDNPHRKASGDFGKFRNDGRAGARRLSGPWLSALCRRAGDSLGAVNF